MLVQNVEKLRAELHGRALKKLRVLCQRKIEIAETGVTESVASQVAGVRRYRAAVQTVQSNREILSHEVLVVIYRLGETGAVLEDRVREELLLRPLPAA